MQRLSRLAAFLLISFYGLVSFLPATVLAATTAPKVPFPSCTITVKPTVINPGGAVTITWQSTNATAGAITNVGNVSPNGSKNILPSSAQLTTYIGSFTGPGGTANCQASVQVSYGTVTGSNSDVVTPSNPVNIGSATTYNPNQSIPALVTCGTGGFVPGSTSGSDPNASTGCQACNLAQLVSNLINFAIGVSIPLAAGLFAWAGVLYFSSGANPGNKETARKIFSSALLGFLLIITSWLIINTLLHVLLDKGKVFTGANWFTVQCDAGTRPVDTNINQVINSVLPGGSATGGGPGGISTNGTQYTPNGTTQLTDDQKDDLLDKCILNNDQNSCNAYDKVMGITQTGSNQTTTVTLQNGTQQTFTCPDCTQIPPDIPGYNRSLTCSQQAGGACQMDAGLVNNVQSLKSNLSDAGIGTDKWLVTEAWPPTVYHASTDQNAGSSIDISACNSNMGLTSSADIGNCIQSFTGAASASNLRAQYEVSTQSQRDAICSAVPASCGNVLVVSYITGSHFSIYKK